MIKLSVIVVSVWTWLLLSKAVADPLVGADLLGAKGLPAGAQAEVSSPPEIPTVPQLPLIAGRPFEEAQAILRRHEQELIHLPGANGVSLDGEGLIVYTNNPTVVPLFVEGLPVRAAPPLPSGPEAGEPTATESQREAGSPAEMQCGPEAYWDAALGQCQRHEALTTSDSDLLPPPPGVIILRPGGVRELADTCPGGFREVAGLNGWRFCVDRNNPEPLPPLEVPPIAGIPYEEALKIVERHREELMRLPGVESVGLDREGIRVEAKNSPPGLPATVEGLPVRVVPPSAGPLIGASHTFNTRVRPLHGGVAISDDLSPANGGTLSTVGLFQGRPWLIFPSHLLVTCSVTTQPCPVGTSLSNCTHYSGTERIRQPTGTVPEIVGFVQRWDALQTGVNTTDAALAFMDNNTTEGDGYPSADRTLELWGSFSGDEATPAVSATATVTVVTIDPTNSGTHLKPARVTAVGQTRNVGFGCRGSGSPPVPLISQMDLQATGNVCFTPGDSGSPVLDGAGRIIGTFHWIDTGSATCPGGGFVRGGGTSASATRQVLGFERWYGTQTVNDQTIGIFRPSTQRWIFDNGNGKLDACGTDLRYYDKCLGPFGLSTDVPVTGRWDNTIRKIGVFRNGTWYLDYNGDGIWNTGDLQVSFIAY